MRRPRFGLSAIGSLRITKYFVGCRLGGNKVTDDDLFYLKDLHGLSVLELQNTQITDQGLVHLIGLTELWRLDLSDTQITDQGLAHLGKLTSLKYLGLSNTQVTDSGLKELKGLQLPNLYLDGTEVTEGTAATMQAAAYVNFHRIDLTDISHMSFARLRRWAVFRYCTSVSPVAPIFSSLFRSCGLKRSPPCVRKGLLGHPLCNNPESPGAFRCTGWCRWDFSGGQVTRTS